MKVALVYNKDLSGVINTFGMQNKEVYNQKVVKKVASCLEAGGHNVCIIDGNMHVVEAIQEFMPKVVEGERMGMVFNMAYGIQGESRYTHIPSMLEMLGIPYVGSSPSGHALALDKVITKIIMQKHGLPTPNFWVYSSPEEDMSDVIYPVIVKPKMESVSFGLKVVDNEDDLREAVSFILEEFQQQALVEQFIRGREFAVGLLGNNPVETFPVLEIDLDNDPDAIQLAEDKLRRPKNKICPADIDPELAHEMQSLSRKAFQSLHLRDFSRVDIRLDQNNNIYLLEINSMASLGMSGSYVHAANVAGYDFSALVNKMLDVATVRYFATSQITNNGNITKKKIPVPVRVMGFVRSRQTQLETLLKQMINTNSFVRNVEGVNSLGQITAKSLLQLGFKQQTISHIEVGNCLFFSNTEHDNYDVLLLGNLDNATALAGQQFFHATEHKLFGTGIWEHKGGLAVMIGALQALRFVRKLRNLKIGILLTSDDSLQGRFARKLVMEKSQQAMNVLGIHGAFLNGGVVTSRSGAAVYSCHMNLKHTDSTDKVVQATRVFTRLVQKWTELSRPDEGLVIAPHHMSFETNITEPYSHGQVTLSVRFQNHEQFVKTDEQIKKLIPTKYKKDFYFQLEGGERRPPMMQTPQVEALWNIIKSISSDLDIRMLKEHRWSSADICFVDSGKSMIDGLGPAGVKPTHKSEYILKHSLFERTVLLAMCLYELSSN